MPTAQQIQNQWDADNDALAALRRDLPLLKQRATAALGRAQKLTVFLAGSGAAELLQLQTDVTTLGLIVTRCQVAAQGADARLQQIRIAVPSQIEQVTRLALVALQPTIIAFQADTLTVAACEGRATTAENTYQAARTLQATYPRLGLTLAVISHARGPTNRLSAAELGRLNTKLQGHNVIDWVLGRLPVTRGHRSGEQMLVPRALEYFPYQPSSEIFHDWVWQTVDGHGQPAASMKGIVGKIHTNTPLLNTPFVTEASGANWKVTHPNIILNVILSADRTVLITYYNTQ